MKTQFSSKENFEGQIGTSYNKQFRTKSLADEIYNPRSPKYGSEMQQSTKSNSIMNSVGFLQTISSSALRHSSPYYSFPKGNRFTRPNLASLYTDNDILLPSTLSPKTTTQGFGNKFIFHPYTLRNAKINPSPDRYDIAEKLSNHKRGKSIGISYEYYKKVYNPNQQYINIELSKQIPPVGQYEVMQEPGQNKLKYSLYSRYNQKLPDQSPPANLYTPKTILQENTRFNKTTFGKGMKLDFTKPKNNNPGPGTYIPPSPFDKFYPNKKQELKQQLLRRLQIRNDQKDFLIQ